ncbi:MAG: hypothetical protein AAFX90_20265 [Pseudomonadota bacterium]
MKHLTIALFTLIGTQVAATESINYVCKMTKQDSHGWIASEYSFRIDPAATSAMAASSYQDWAEAKFKNRGSKGYRLVWNIDETMAAGGNVRVRYQANLNPSDNSVKVRMAFLQGNFANKPYGIGTCSLNK